MDLSAEQASCRLQDLSEAAVLAGAALTARWLVLFAAQQAVFRSVFPGVFPGVFPRVFQRASTHQVRSMSVARW